MSPFKRVNHKLTPELEPGFEWLFDADVKAIDKLHGMNVAIFVKDGRILGINNRANVITRHPINILENPRFLSGILNASSRGWLKDLEDGVHYGELIGPTINGNLHQVREHLWVPFRYLQEKCFWKSWSENEYPKTFDSISEWFKTLPSLFSKKIGKEVVAEGLIFWKPGKNKFGNYAKLRRDMFNWYSGPAHK